jgi:hypothetical protein
LPSAVAGEIEDASRKPPNALNLAAGKADWILRLPKEESVMFRGIVSYDQAGVGTASMLYPAPNLGGLVAAIITHGLLVEAAKKDQKDKMQAAADTVLMPYQNVLNGFRHRELMTRAIGKASTGGKGRLVEAADKSATEILVESAPVFSLTQDQGAIVLDNVVGISMPGAESGTSYTIRIVSTAKNAPDLQAFWTDNEGEQLKEVSAQLFALSLDIAFGEANQDSGRDAIPYRTIRYREGSAERIERAQVLGDRCERLLIRTLRGVFMSVPASRVAAAALPVDTCDARAVASQK